MSYWEIVQATLASEFSDLVELDQAIRVSIRLALGFGREATAVLGTLLALVVLNAVPHVIDRLQTKKSPPLQ